MPFAATLFKAPCMLIYFHAATQQSTALSRAFATILDASMIPLIEDADGPFDILS